MACSSLILQLPSSSSSVGQHPLHLDLSLRKVLVSVIIGDPRAGTIVGQVELNSDAYELNCS